MMDRAALERACHGALYAHLDASDEVSGAGREAIIALGIGFLDHTLGLEHLEHVVSTGDDDGLMRAGKGTALPIHGTVLRLLFFVAQKDAPHLSDRLGALVPRIERFHQALHEQSSGSAFLCQSDTDDEALVPGVVHQGGQIEVGRNALLIQSESDLADVAIHTGHETQKIMVRRTRMARSMARRLWRPEFGCFCSRERDWVDPVAADLFPLYCGVAQARQAREIQARHLTSAGFWSPHPLAQGSRPQLRLVSPLVNWLMVTGLYRYGFDDLSRRLFDQTVAMVSMMNVRESYQADSGAGQGNMQDPLTAAVVLQMLHSRYDQQRLSLF